MKYVVFYTCSREYIPARKESGNERFYGLVLDNLLYENGTVTVFAVLKWHWPSAIFHMCMSFLVGSSYVYPCISCKYCTPLK